MAVNSPISIRGRRRPQPPSTPVGRNGGILPPRNNSNRSPRRSSRPSFLPKLQMNNNPLRRKPARGRGSSSRRIPSSQQQQQRHNNIMMVQDSKKEIEMMEQYSIDYDFETSTDCGKSTSTASINCSPAARSALNNDYNDNNNIDNNIDMPCSSFAIPHGHTLSPRGDTWLYLFLSSIASTASLAVANPPSHRNAPKDQVALAIMSISTILSLGVAVAYRYTPSRHSLTSSLRLGGIPYEQEHNSSLTLETLMALGLFTLWMIESTLALGNQIGGNNDDLAVTSSQVEIWNTNLYFSTWVSASLISYLLADLLTIQDAHGSIPRVYSCVLGNAIARGWMLLFIATASLLAFSITFRSGDICTAGSSVRMMMETTSGDICTTGTLVGIIVGILGMVWAGGYLLISLLERKVVDDDGHSHSRRRRRQTQEQLQSKKNLPSSILAAMALIGYSINAAFVTLPPLHQGMSSEPCNMYFSSWLCFALSLYLCIRQAEAYLVPGRARDVRSLLPPQDVKSLKATTKTNGLRRNSSRDSNTSTAPPSNFDSDPEYENEQLVEQQEEHDDEEEDMESHQFTQAAANADKAMAAMADSVSEDGPMLFLPVVDNQFDASELLSLGSSWPSVTNIPPNGKTFQYNNQQQPPPQTLSAPQQQQPGVGGGREPHKPRSINPGGRRYNAAAASAKTGSRPQAEPPAYNSSENNCSRPSIGIDPAPLGASFIGPIDSKIQANSLSSGEGNNGLRQSHSSTNTTKSSRDPDGHSVPLTGGSTSEFFMGSVASTSGKSYPVSVNPLDRIIRPPTRSLLGVGGRQQVQAEPSVRVSRDPSFRAPPPPPPQPPRQTAQLRRSCATLDTITPAGSSKPGGSQKRDAESTIGSAAPTIDQSTSAKSKSSKHSGRSKSRSGSRKKRRSKSRDGSGEKKNGSRKSRSSSRNKKKSSSGRSNKSRKSKQSSGDRSSMHSSGTPAQGPPTVSASSHATPRTNDDQSRMGKMGPGNHLPTSQGSGDHQRPVVAVQGSMETMSMMSEVSVDACFNSSGNPSIGTGSSHTNENKTRQGAVDKMVMEALRQAQTARQTSHHDLGRRSRTASNQTMPAPQDLSNSVPNTPGLLAKGMSPPFTPGGQSNIIQTPVHQIIGQGATTPSSRHSRGSKSPHHKKPAIKAQRRRSKRSKASGTSASPSLHSFYSESQATSFDADDAFAC